MYTYSLQVWSRTIIGGSLLIALLFLVFDLHVEMIALSFSLFFFFMLMAFIVSIPNLIVFTICNYVLVRYIDTVATFRVLSLAGIAVGGMVEGILLIGLRPADSGQFLLAVLIFGCYLLTAFISMMLVDPPSEHFPEEAHDILDDDLLRK